MTQRERAESDDEEIRDWIQCDNCEIWRRDTEGLRAPAEESFRCWMMKANYGESRPEDELHPDEDDVIILN